MTGGGSGSNGVTRIEPPSYQLPYLQSGLKGAAEQYNAGGNPTIPFSQQSEAALAGTEARARAGSPVVGAAQDYTQKSLTGGFLGSNPYLDQTFERAAQATQGQLASQFAGAGRNVGASEGNRAQQLNDLASQIYGGNYANERQLQQQSVGSAIPLGNQDYVDLGQLGQVGANVENLANQYGGAQGQNLDQYLARVRGTDYGSTQTSPYNKNTGAGLLGGALVGSQLGSSLNSGYGGYVGAGLGALLGGYG
jgi:hypothetical protein